MLFVTTLVCNIMFGFLNYLCTFAILLAWVAFITFLKRYAYLNDRHPSVFDMIAYSGFTVSTMMGRIFCVKNNNAILLSFLMVYNIAGQSILHLPMRNGNVDKAFGNIVMYIFQMLNTWIIAVTYIIFFRIGNLGVRDAGMQWNDWVFVLLMLAYASFNIAKFAFCDRVEMPDWMPLLLDDIRCNIRPGGMYGFALWAWSAMITTLMISIEINATTILLSFIGCMAAYWIMKHGMQYVTSNTKAVCIIFEIFILIEQFIILCMEEYTFPLCVPFMVMPLVYGSYLLYGNDCSDCQAEGMSVMTLWLLLSKFMGPPVENFIMMLIFAVAFIKVFLYNRMHYKAWAYILLLLTVLFHTDSIADIISDNIRIFADVHEYINNLLEFLPYLATALIHLYVSNFMSSKGEKIASLIVNGCIMLAGLGLLHDYAHSIVFMPCIVVTVLIFIHNSREILDWEEQRGKPALLEAYVACKYVILIMTIAGAAGINDIISSLVLVALSVASIFVGFKLKRCGFRVFGLVMSMIGIAKLLVVDVHSSNTAINAGCFVICGILCLMVSYLYNKAENNV